VVEPLIGKTAQGHAAAGACMSIEEAEEKWDSLSYRERMMPFFYKAAVANYTMPVALLSALYIFLGFVWFAFFWYVIRDPTQELFSERNARKFVLYNVLHGVLGFGAANGPLGLKMSFPFGSTGLMFLTPGTLCSPLLPAVVGCVQRLPARRSALHVLLNAAYMAALAYAIAEPSFARIHIVCVAMAAATVFDFTVFLASRGEHYGYMVVCMAFPDWIAGCQWVQLMLWIMVGFSKCGPWFKYVIQGLLKDAIWTPCLPAKTMARLFNRDFDRDDFTPSRTAHALAALGAAGEWLGPLCCALGPAGGVVNAVGVFGMIAYHSFIWSTLPTASVFEWQYYTMYMTYFLYRLHPMALPSSPPLLVLLAFVLLGLPVVGQLRPSLVPFLLAYRQYAGNWRIGTVLLRKSAKHKFDKLKTYESIYWWKAAPPELGGEHAYYKFMSPLISVPLFRGMIPIVEAFLEKTGADIDDFWEVPTMTFITSVNGWNLGGSWEICRECWRHAVVEVCGLERGDMYLLMGEPAGILPPYTVGYRVMDMVKGPLDAELFASVPFSELEGTHPVQVRIKPERIQSGRSIAGTFLDTYYI